MSLTKVSYSLITGANINVLDYGADPTGLTDSSAAIQAAIDYGSANYKTVYIPSGVYRCDSQLTAATTPASHFFTLTGDGITSCIWNNNSNTAVLQIGNPITGVETTGVSISNLLLWNPDGNGLKVTHTSKSNFTNLWAWTKQVGFFIEDQSIINNFTNLTFSSNFYGYIRLMYPVLPGVASTNYGILVNRTNVECNGLVFINSVVEGGGLDGIAVLGTHVAITFINPVSEGNLGYGFNFSGLTGFNANLTVINGYSEANFNAMFITKQANMVFLNGQYGQIPTGANIFLQEVKNALFTNLSCYNFSEDALCAGNVLNNVVANGAINRLGYTPLLAVNSGTPAIAPPAVFGSLAWKTANTSPTTYTNFTGGYAGLNLQIFFSDANSTVDFTGSSLKGNNGVDWTPANGDWMNCVNNNGFWYCTINEG